MLARLFRIILVAFTGVAGSAADLANASAAATLPSVGNSLLALMRVLGALAMVFAVFFGGLWVFRNWQRLLVRQGRTPKLSVLESKSLGQRHTIFVIGYEQQRLLIAASPGGVNLLTALPPPRPEVATVREPNPATAPSFASLLPQTLANQP